MKKHISYPKVGQFRNAVESVVRRVTYVGKNELDEPIYDDTINKPIILFKGSIKLHGTNSSVCFNELDGFWSQGRNIILSKEENNYGFFSFADSRSELFESMIKFVAEKNNIDLFKNTITIFGEFVGNKIMKGTAINNLQKSFFIFDVKCTPNDENLDPYFINIDNLGLSNIKSGVFDIKGFDTFSLVVDFNNPDKILSKLEAITDVIAEKCPVASAFGFDGIGEGVVWKGVLDGSNIRFKVKNEKFKSSSKEKKGKTKVELSPEKMNSIKDFVDYSVTENRFNQCILQIFGESRPFVEKLGEVISWISNDIYTEEKDTLVKNKLTKKDVSKSISNKIKEMFFAIN